MKAALLTATALAGLFASVPAADAAVILNFGQLSALNTIGATVNGSSTQTTIAGANVDIGITQIIGGAPTNAILNFSAASIGPATPAGALFTQSYSGTFAITSGLNGTGTNFLSGSFIDAVFGAGTGLTLTASSATPGASVAFTSSVIPAIDLGAPEAISLSFSNVTPPVGIVGSTFAPFTAAVSGNFSAETASAVPEPATLTLLGVGLLGASVLRRRRQG